MVVAAAAPSKTRFLAELHKVFGSGLAIAKSQRCRFAAVIGDRPLRPTLRAVVALFLLAPLSADSRFGSIALPVNVPYRDHQTFAKIGLLERRRGQIHIHIISAPDP